MTIEQPVIQPLLLERALTLKQAAEILNVSYQTIYAARERIAFRLPGGTIWRVWPSSLAALGEKRNNLTRLTLRVGGENECQSAKIQPPALGGSMSARQAASELDDLLGRKTAKQRRSTTTR